MLAFALGVLMSSVRAGEIVTGKVVGITDGDTLTLLNPAKTQVKICLAGIDAPEGGQAYGQKATQALFGKGFGQTIKVTVTDTDRYGRTVGNVLLQDRWFNLEIVADGLAWHYTFNFMPPDLAAGVAHSLALRRMPGPRTH